MCAPRTFCGHLGGVSLPVCVCVVLAGGGDVGVCLNCSLMFLVLEFHLERTPLLTSPHPPELTGQSVAPLDLTSSMCSVCDYLWFACLCSSVVLGLYLNLNALCGDLISPSVCVLLYHQQSTVMDCFYFYVRVFGRLR